MALYTLDTVTLPSTYSYNGATYNLETSIDVSEQSSGHVMLGEYKSGDNMIAVIGQDGGVVAPVDSSNLFSLTIREEILIKSHVKVIDLSNLDTSNVTNMSYMFEHCSSLTNLDVSHLDTSKVTTMEVMFGGCESLSSLNLSSFDTSKVTNMSSMFSHCTNLTNLDVSHFDTSNVANMNGMFAVCISLTSLDLSNLDTSNVTDMSRMFYNCGSLTQVTVGCNWVIGETTTTTEMFTDAGVSAVTKVCNE